MNKRLQKIILFLLTGMMLESIHAQVGIKTELPTETFDVNGYARVRTLPTFGANIQTNENGNKGASLYQPKQMVLADTNGVLGKSDINENFPANANETNIDNSKSIIVIKNFRLKDWPDRIKINGASVGASTGMSVDKWDAFIVASRFTYFRPNPGKSPLNIGVYDENNPDKNIGGWGVFLNFDTGTWRIQGDITQIGENQYVTVLFIKRQYIISSDFIIVK